MGLGLDWRSPLGLADQFSLRASRDTVTDRWHHSESQSLFYSVPSGWWTFAYGYMQVGYGVRDETSRLPSTLDGDVHLLGASLHRGRSNFSYSYKQFDYHASGSGLPFKLDGDSRSHQVRAEHVLYSDRVGKTSILMGLKYSHSSSNKIYLGNNRQEGQSTWGSETLLGFNHLQRVGSGFVKLYFDWLQVSGHPHGDDGHAHYAKYSLTFSYLQPFPLWGELFSFDSLAAGQKSEGVLPNRQRISLGGNSSVRGFKDQTLIGDTGGYWRNKVRWHRAVEWKPLRPWLQEYGVAVAYDIGVIRHDYYSSGTSGRMSGSAIELDVRGRYFASSISFARSLERPSAIERREYPIFFRVDAFF